MWLSDAELAATASEQGCVSPKKLSGPEGLLGIADPSSTKLRAHVAAISADIDELCHAIQLVCTFWSKHPTLTICGNVAAVAFV
jgi:hypothetical protein